MAIDRHSLWEARCRRAWRLASLFTGSADEAASLFAYIMSDARAVRDVAAERLDRLIILRSREWAAERGPRSTHADHEAGNRVDASTARAALAVLSHQAREAWLLQRVDQLDEIDSARAMDCSKTALANHLVKADDLMRQRFGDQVEEVAAVLRRAADQLEPTPHIEAWRQRRRKRRLWRLIALALVVLAVAVAVWVFQST